MKKPTKDPQPTWANVKAKLASFDRMGLMGLIQDLYAADKDNQRFLHARFGLGEDVLKPYKETLDRWLWPDVLRNQDASVVKAKTSHFQLQKGCRRTCWARRTDGFLLRTSRRILQRYRLPRRELLRCTGPYVRTGSRRRGPTTCQPPQQPDRPAGSGTRDQPQLRLRRRRPHGLRACEIHQGTDHPSVRFTTATQTLPKISPTPHRFASYAQAVFC